MLEILVENGDFSYPLHSVPRYTVGILPSRLVWKTRMVGLPDGKKTFRIFVTVYTQYRRVLDGRTDRQTDILPRHSPLYAYASRGKDCDNMLSRFRLIPERDGQTDGQTDGQNCYINIARQCADVR